MKKKYLNKNSIISFILTISILLMPLSFIPKKVEAQSIAGYTSGLAPIIASLPQCRDIIGSGISDLFSGFELYNANKAIKAELDSEINSLINEFTGVETFDPISAENQKRMEAELKIIRESTTSLNANSTCIQSIGRLIIKMLLQKLTISTVNWINSGFDGGPAFIQDPGKFFNDIAKNEILQFGIEINNPELFPFGRAWMQNTALAFNNKFADNARYSLDELIQDTTPEFSAATFQQDFSQGGWNAWAALTQIPANNPFGFKIMADNEIQRRLAGTTQSTAEYVQDALQASSGFLGDERCVEPEGVTKTENDAYLRGEEDARRCERWEYVTPGKLISEAATTVMKYQNNAYLNVEDLNDAVAAILDALLSQFSSNIMEKGFANLGNEGSDGSLFYNSSFVDIGVYTTQTEKDFTPVHLSSSWLNANKNFNIRTGLTQALIDEQRTYSDKLALQNKELMSTTDGEIYKLDKDTGLSNSYGLIPAIYQLDYCIPGPHPGWEQDSRRTLAAVTGKIVPKTVEELADQTFDSIVSSAQTLAPLAGAAIGASIGSIAPVVGTIIGAVVGVIVGWLIGVFSGSDDYENVRLYYSVQLATLTGLNPFDHVAEYDPLEDSRSLNIQSKQGIVNVLNIFLDRYIEIMNKTYFLNSETLPTVTGEASANFNQVVGYSQMIKNNEEKISLLKTTINTLGEIKDKIDNLNAKLELGQIIEEQYEEDLKPQINAFGRLSSNMVNGNDIAGTDNLLKQIIDKKNYIYNNLLKGPYGCEADLERPQQKFLSAGSNVIAGDWDNYDINSVKRMIYPFSILYDYNIFEGGEALPDPWDSGYTNNMPTENMHNKFGPGFLSFVLFGNHPSNNECPPPCREGSERLKTSDLIHPGDDPGSKAKALGLRKGFSDTGNTVPTAGPFETIIGVY